MDVGLRIKELRKEVHLTQKQFSDVIRIDNSQLSKIERGELLPTIAQLVEISSNFKITLDSIVFGKPEKETNVYKLKSDLLVQNQAVPLYNIEAAAGIVALFNSHSDSVNPIDYISIPNLPKCDGALYVTGDSMYPLLKSGDIIMYKEIQDIVNDIFWGEMYLLGFELGGEEHVMVKYIQKSDIPGHIKLVSQNKNHQDKDLKLDKIRALGLVKASIRINSMY